MGKVADRRAAAKKAGQSMKQYKAANNIPTKSGSSSSSSSAKASSNKSVQSSGGSNTTMKNPGSAPMTNADRRAANKPLTNQTVSKASEYDYGQFRKGSVNTSELMAMRKQGLSREEVAASAGSSGLRIGKGAQRKMDKWDERAAAKEKAQQHIQNTTQHEEPEHTAEPVGTPEPVREQQPYNPPATTTPAPSIPISTPTIPTSGVPGAPNVNPVQDNDMEQNVNQDNDINTNINGDGNYVHNNQDNSIRQYGGDNRQFTYVGSGNGGRYGGNHLDTPASMATLGGYYDVDDSPAKQAKFLDLHTTLNRDNQKRYANTGHIAQGAIHRAGMNQSVDINALDARIHNREQYSRAKSEMMGMNLFGDMYNYTPPQYMMPDPEKPVEKPDFGEMYDQYTDF